MKRIIPILLLVSITLAAGFWLGRHNSSSPQLEVISNAKQVYVCPMHSHIVQDHPGNCPICGMDLVLSGQGDIGTQIHVETSTQQKFGVRLATAEITELTQDIHTYATLTADLNTLQRITATTPGVLIKLHANYPGQKIAAGEPLYDIFSAELLNLQNEYIDYLTRRTQSLKSAEETRVRNRQMIESMLQQNGGENEQLLRMKQQTEEQIASMLLPMERDGERLNGRLKFAGFTDAMLKHLELKQKSWESVTIRAQHACTVYEVNARAGMSLSPMSGAMSEILTCVKPNRAWLEVTFYPEQTEFVHEGETLDVQFGDGNQIKTKLTGLSTITDSVTRTIKARIPIKITADQHLGDFADVTLHSSPRKVLTIPASAVIRNGNGNFVMRALGNGHFIPQKIITGISNDDHIGIIDGLEVGDKVAVNGQFLLDAAASIADSAQRYQQSK